jgi:PAS domain-containing protein
MSSDFRRRRSNSGSGRSKQRIKPEEARPARVGRAELAACGGIAVVAFALIALIWMVADREIQEQRAGIRDRTEQVLIGQAATIAETVAHELLLIDQSLTVIQSAWKANSEVVDLEKWQQQMPALLAVSDDIFICDEKHIIRQDILPKAVGQGVGAAYVTFPHGSLELFESDGTKNKESLLLQGQTGLSIDTRQFLMYVIRPLDHPKGWLIGASYRSEELTKLFAGAALGYNSVIALVDTGRGIVQAVVGPAARRPKTDLSGTALLSTLTRSRTGTWFGETAIDGIERMHAFHRVGERDMAIVVAANWTELMAPADSLGAGTRSLALIGSVIILLIAGLLLWELHAIRGNRRQKRIFERSRTELKRLRDEEATQTARSRLHAARLQMVVESITDGIALFDSGLRLVQWNGPFIQGIGIDPVHDMPLDTLLREQARKGLFGTVLDLEAETGRRVGILRTGEVTGVSLPGPNGEHLVLRGLPMAEGGFMLLLIGLDLRQPSPAAGEPAVLDEPSGLAMITPAVTGGY